MDMDTNASIRRRRKAVNVKLALLGKQYHDGIPIAVIDAILEENGFQPTEPAIYCGREGRIEPELVGDHTYLALSWYKMELSGRYEITAYVS